MVRSSVQSVVVVLCVLMMMGGTGGAWAVISAPGSDADASLRARPVEASRIAFDALEGPASAGAKAGSARERAKAEYVRGLRLFSSNHNSEAIAAFNKAIKLDPKFPDAHRALGSILARLGNIKGMCRELKIYVKLAPHASDTTKITGEIAKHADTVPACRGRTSSEPDAVAPDKISPTAKKGAPHPPDTARWLLSSALTHYKRRNFVEASRLLRDLGNVVKAERVDRFARAFTGAIEAARTEKPVLAIPLLESALELDRGIAKAFQGEIRGRLADMHALEAERLLRKGILVGARAGADKALTYDASNKNAAKLSAALDRRSDELLAKAKLLWPRNRDAALSFLHKVCPVAPDGAACKDASKMLEAYVRYR